MTIDLDGNELDYVPPDGRLSQFEQTRDRIIQDRARAVDIELTAALNNIDRDIDRGYLHEAVNEVIV